MQSKKLFLVRTYDSIDFHSKNDCHRPRGKGCHCDWSKNNRLISGLSCDLTHKTALQELLGGHPSCVSPRCSKAKAVGKVPMQVLRSTLLWLNRRRDVLPHSRKDKRIQMYIASGWSRYMSTSSRCVCTGGIFNAVYCHNSPCALQESPFIAQRAAGPHSQLAEFNYNCGFRFPTLYF